MLQQIRVVIVLVGLLSQVTHGNQFHPVTCHESANQHREYAEAIHELYQDPFYANFTLSPTKCSENGRIDATHSICINQGSALGIKDNKIRTRHNNKPNPCTWKIERDIDENRFPRIISKVQCTCRHCHKGTCVPVFSAIPIMKKMCDETSRIYTYRKTIYEVPVACECVRARKAKRPKSRRTKPVMSE